MKRQPPGDTRYCASCGERRGNVRRGWAFHSVAGREVAATCPTCPTWTEPIRREITGGRVRFVAVVGVRVDGKRRQLKRRFDSLHDARAWVAEVRTGSATAARRGQAYADRSQMTVSQVCAAWLDARRAEVGTPGGVREVTVNGYASALSSVLDLLGDRVARDITPGDIEAALRTLATSGGRWGRPLSARSTSYALGALRQAYKHAVREGWTTGNPAALARAPRANLTVREDGGTGKARRWTPSQLADFRQHVDAEFGPGSERFAAWPWVAAGVRLALCGLRRSEVLGLDWSRVDLDAGTVQIAASRVKTGRGHATSLGAVKVANSLRTVDVETIHPGTVRALRALWLALGRPEHGLVVSDAAGQPVQPDAFSRRFRVLCEAAGVPVLASVHATRHTLATALQEVGVPASQAAALLGHDLQTYLRFYVVTDDDGSAAAAAVAGRLFAASGGL